MKKQLKDMALFLAVGLAVLLIDQLTKFLVTKNLRLYESITVIPGLFNITFITNTGAAFGIMQGMERWRHIFFQTVSVGALMGMVYLYMTSASRHPLFFWGLSLIFGGAAGNLVDRIRYRHVVDFLDFYIRDWHWPAFNVADSAITIGAFCLAYYFLFSHEKN